MKEEFNLIEKENIFYKLIILGIVLFVGFTVAEEIKKQLPKEFKINYKKIIIESLIFSLILGGISYIILSIIM